MAIIQCEAGLTDITEKVEQAIFSDEDFHMVSITTDVVMDTNGGKYLIPAKIAEFEDSDEEYRDYFLTNVEMY